MATLFIRIDQNVGLSSRAEDALKGAGAADIGVQFGFSVKSGSVGIEALPEHFLEGEVSIGEQEGVPIARLIGLIKVKIYEAQESQIAEKRPLYIEGLNLAGAYEVFGVTAHPFPENQTINVKPILHPSLVMRTSPNPIIHLSVG